MWLCNGDKYTSSASFNNEYPGIIIADIKPPPSKRLNEGYAEPYARLRDMKDIINIGDIQ